MKRYFLCKMWKGWDFAIDLSFEVAIQPVLEAGFLEITNLVNEGKVRLVKCLNGDFRVDWLTVQRPTNAHMLVVA